VIQPKDIKQKALRLWTSKRLLRDWIEPADLFPFRISAGRMSSRQISDQYAAVKTWIACLEEHAAEGYSIVYRQTNHRQLGPQKVPSSIVFVTRQACLRLIGKQRQFERFKALAEKTLTTWPNLRPVLLRRPLDILALESSWDKLLAVCRYFIDHPRPRLYLRQLDIPGVDSKFIERHLSILTDLLDALLPEDTIDADASGGTTKGFAQRYGLLHESPTIRLRVLDAACAVSGLRDLAVPLSDLCQLHMDIDTVFITENKVNGLCFPDVPRAIVIFGLGYGVEALKAIGWLKSKSIYYWGDIDTHGFHILDQLRLFLPGAHSMLMDQDTLQEHIALCVEEPNDKRYTGKLDYLGCAERDVYTTLLQNRWGQNLRLEQERIRFTCVEAFLKRVKA
jgi:hypothetical protein